MKVAACNPKSAMQNLLVGFCLVDLCLRLAHHETYNLQSKIENLNSKIVFTDEPIL
jgi:hypothetical protein